MNKICGVSSKAMEKNADDFDYKPKDIKEVVYDFDSYLLNRSPDIYYGYLVAGDTREDIEFSSEQSNIRFYTHCAFNMSSRNGSIGIFRPLQDLISDIDFMTRNGSEEQDTIIAGRLYKLLESCIDSDEDCLQAGVDYYDHLLNLSKTNNWDPAMIQKTLVKRRFENAFNLISYGNSVYHEYIYFK